MFANRSKNSIAILTSLLAIVMFGCEAPNQPSGAATGSATTQAHDDHGHDHDDHAGHAHPETLSAAVTELGTLVGTIKTAMTADKPGDADSAVHKIADLLDFIPKLAAKSGMSDENQAEVKKVANELFDVYGKFDTAIHSGASIEYSDYSDAIENGMKSLTELAK